MKYLILILLGLLPINAMAQTPTPSAHPAKKIEQKIQDTKAKEKKLKSELASIKTDLSKKKKSLVEVAQEIQANEQKLTELEKQIKTKINDQIALEDSLDEDRKSISDLVLALQRIRRVPPEAIIAKPDAPLKTAQSTMLLESILPRIYNRADQLKVDLKRLDSLLKSLEVDKAAAVKASKQLQNDKKQLTALLMERERIYAKTEKNIASQQAALKKISSEARDLKDLVQKIEKKQKAERARLKREKKAAQQAKRETKTTTTSRPAPAVAKITPVPKAGQAQLPVSGFMTVRYGATDEIGAISKGIKIKSRANALIVAPMGGVVEYAGSFKGYGKIVILQHEKGYHSLIAGLGAINTKVGRAVSSGEPIGKMSRNTSNENDITLYYELRYNGKTVNPSKRISGLR